MRVTASISTSIIESRVPVNGRPQSANATELSAHSRPVFGIYREHVLGKPIRPSPRKPKVGNKWEIPLPRLLLSFRHFAKHKWSGIGMREARYCCSHKGSAAEIQLPAKCASLLVNAALDVQLLVMAWLPPESLLVVSRSCTSLVEVVRSDTLWRWHLRDLHAENPGASIALRDDQRTYQRYFDFRAAIETAAAERDAALLDDFKPFSKPRSMRALAKLGTITGQGTLDASFEPFGDMPTQVSGAAALELLNLMKTVPKEKGVKVGTACEKAAHIIGVSSTALHNLHRWAKDARTRKLILILKAPFPMISGVAPLESSSVDEEAVLRDVLAAS